MEKKKIIKLIILIAVILVIVLIMAVAIIEFFPESKAIDCKKIFTSGSTTECIESKNARLQNICCPP